MRCCLFRGDRGLDPAPYVTRWMYHRMLALRLPMGSVSLPRGHPNQVRQAEGRSIDARSLELPEETGLKPASRLLSACRLLSATRRGSDDMKNPKNLRCQGRGRPCVPDVRAAYMSKVVTPCLS